MYKVILTSCGNPDYNQDPYRPISPTDTAACQTMKECSEACREYITEHNLGGGNWAGGEVFDLQHKLVAQVSYNGRVWDPSGKEITI